MLLALFFPALVIGQTAGDEKLVKASDVVLCTKTKAQYDSYTAEKRALLQVTAYPMDNIEISAGDFSGGSNPSVTGNRLLFTIISSTNRTVKIGASEDSYYYTGITKSQYKHYSNLFVSGEGAAASNPQPVNNRTAAIYVPSRINIDGVVYTVTEISDDWIINNQIGQVNNHNDIYIPQTVKKIGNRGFSGYSSGQFINLKFYKTNADGSPARSGSSLIVGDAYNSIEEIGEEAFHNNRFTSLPIGASTRSLGKGCFYGCQQLTIEGVESPLAASSVTALPDNVFYLCTGLSGELKIPANITSLGFHTFGRCEYLTNFDLSLCVGLDELPDGVFFDCIRLSPLGGKLVIPSHIKTVGALWWAGGSGTNINQTPEGVTSIYFGDVRNLSLGAYKTKGITEFTVPSTVTSLRSFTETTGLYKDNNVLQRATFPAGLSISIPDSCFYTCEALSSINFGDVTSIGKFAFARCKSLSSVSIPSSVTSIGSNTFSNCTSLVSAEINANTVCLPDSMFYRCSLLSSVTFPSGLTTIGKGCFYNCCFSTLPDFPSSLSVIDDCALTNNLLSSFEMTSAMKSNLCRIGEYAFSGNKIPYMKWDVASAYNSSLVLEKEAFGGQKTSLTVEFTPECTTVPEYLNNTNHESPFSISKDKDNNNSELRALRIIVPISSIKNYTSHKTMGTVLPTDYRVKFKWGSFADESSLKTDIAKDFAQRSYYPLYNITPQQRLVATSAWENDALNFRPTIHFYGNQGLPVMGKGSSFDEEPAFSFGPKKVILPADAVFYTNSVDYWQDNVAVPLLTEETFFEEPYTEGENELGFAFNSSDFDVTDEASYPKSLMPYSIHTYHANISSENPVGEPRIGRRPVMDGIVPPNKGIVIDYPKPGYYLVPPEPTDSGMIAMYPVKQHVSGLYDGADKRYSIDPKIFANFWFDLTDYRFESGDPQMNYFYKPIPYETVLTLDSRLAQFISDNDLEGIDDLSEVLSAEQKAALKVIIADYESVIANASSIEIDDFDDYQFDDDWYESFLFGEIEIFTDGQGGKWIIPEIEYFYFYCDDDPGVIKGISMLILNSKLRAGLASFNFINGDGIFTDENGIVWHMHFKQIRGIAGYSFAQNYPLSEMRNHLNDAETQKIYVYDENQVYTALLNTYYGNWYNILDMVDSPDSVAVRFNKNHDSDTDHNVILPCIDRTWIYPYWAASPYKFETEGQPADRFNSDGTFNHTTYGRMGHGNTYIYIWDEDKSKTALLDSDIQYVNFGFMGGYFVHANAANQTQPNRAYFSIHKDHMKALFPQTPQNGKFFFYLEDNNGNATGITTLDNGRLTTDDDMWFTLSGVRLSGKPSEKGIYIYNGKKIIIR